MRRVSVVVAATLLFLVIAWLALRSTMPGQSIGEMPTVAATAEPMPADPVTPTPPLAPIMATSDVAAAANDAKSPPATPTPQPTRLADPATLTSTSLQASDAVTLGVSVTAVLPTAASLTPTATATAPVTLVPIPNDPIDRTCPNPSPAKPDYARYYLDGNLWPLPNPGIGEHFWLAKPLPGGGRLLTTEWLPYGYDAGGGYLLHNGVDSAEPLGTPVLAVDDGTVIVTGTDADRYYGWRCDWYGHLVVIELDRRWQGQPLYALYGHVLNIIVQPGQRVVRGQQVAEVGFGGAALAPHLHFEVRVGSNSFGATRNPSLWIQPPQTRGLIAGRLLDPQGRPWQGVAITAVGRSEGTADRTSWTYLGDPQQLINPDEGLAENFVIDDLRPGEYELWVSVQGVTYTVDVTVVGGSLTPVEIRTEAFKTPTPAPESTPGD